MLFLFRLLMESIFHCCTPQAGSRGQNGQYKVFGAAFYKKLLGLQGVKPLHREYFVLQFPVSDFLNKLQKQHSGIHPPKGVKPRAGQSGNIRILFDKLAEVKKHPQPKKKRCQTYTDTSSRF